MRSRRVELRGIVPWDEIRRRVEVAGHAIEGNAAPSPERSRAILEQRAQALARPIEALAASDTMLNLITFTLRDERYAVESRFVLEVFRPVEVAPLPAPERPIFGMTAWRGELLPVIDLRSLLDLPGAALSERPMLFVLGRARACLGIPVDVPGEVFAMPARAIQPSAGLATSEYVQGVIPHAAALVLDVDKVLQIAGPEPV